MNLQSQESKKELEIKISRVVQIKNWFENVQLQAGWKLLKEDYLERTFKALQNSLEEENDEIKLRQIQGAIRNMKYLFALPKRIDRLHGELTKMIKKLETQNAGQ